MVAPVSVCLCLGLYVYASVLLVVMVKGINDVIRPSLSVSTIAIGPPAIESHILFAAVTLTLPQ